MDDCDYPLPRWYDRVCDAPVDTWSLDDVCVACRQGVELDRVVPRALTLLEENPRAGHQFDGELLAALSHIESRFWNSHRKLARDAVAIARTMTSHPDPDLKCDLDTLLRNVQ